MKIDIFNSIYDKNDYLAVLGAITGTKESFTDEEKDRLLKIYEESTRSRFDFADKNLAKLLLVLDTAKNKAEPGTSPLVGELSEAELANLNNLVALCADRERTPALALSAKEDALKGDVCNPLALAVARAALNALANQWDVAPYREDVAVLAEFLGRAEDEIFSDASKLLIRVRERVQ